MTNQIKQGDTMAESTRTVAVPDIRRTTPAPFAAFACMMGHTYRVVLEQNRPIALECTRCATTWKTERVNADGQEMKSAS